MPQSLAVVYIHLVFSTKDRRPFLRDPDLRSRTYASMAEISKRLNCPPILINGVDDHCHILARFGRTVTLADWVKELKRISSDFVQSQDLPDFKWQAGYAAFSVSHSNVDRVRAYVARQDEHHRRITFQDELRTLLLKHMAEWDEAYLWD